MEKKQEEQKLTRAQKTEATKGIIKELLAVNFMRHNELIDEVAKLYVARHGGEDTENINDVRGRVGSVLDIMKKESEVGYDGGMYALKARLPQPPVEEKTEKKPTKKEKKETVAEELAPATKKRSKKTKTEEVAEEKPVEEKPKKTAKKTKSAKTVVEEKESSPVVEEKKPPVAEEKGATPKKRGRKKTAEKVPPVEDKITQLPEGEPVGTPMPEPVAPPAPEPVVIPTPEPVEMPAKEVPTPKTEPVKEVEVKAEEIKTPAPVENKGEMVVKPKAEIVQKGVVMDMSFLFGDTSKKAPAKKEERKPIEEKKAPVAEVKKPVAPAVKKEAPVKAEKKEPPVAPPASVKEPAKAENKTENKSAPKKAPVRSARKTVEKPMTADERLKDAFLKRMRTLGGDYFEYYSVYLLERYSMKNGRRLEGLSISGGDHDGGIDGEIVLTDKFGFKETIYIQSKNWDPEKGKEENWVVGETLVQQFIGACACRQAKEGKQHCRGIFITTSRFTPDAQRILEDMSDKVVGYDGNDLFEAAKECQFGLVKKNGEWILDEKLLAGTKAFFEML